MKHVTLMRKLSKSNMIGRDPIALVIVEGFPGSAGTVVGCKFVEYINKGSLGNPNQKTLLAR
ncbi:hypothetical protein C8R48DRAFT_716956 [Suillus tomentosus]|nr:hypothetical protein C8R48DRAFT_716956 [Suillus tomentosus]